jgi:hypothetical protein
MNGLRFAKIQPSGKVSSDEPIDISKLDGLGDRKGANIPKIVIVPYPVEQSAPEMPPAPVKFVPRGKLRK